MIQALAVAPAVETGFRIYSKFEMEVGEVRRLEMHLGVVLARMQQARGALMQQVFPRRLQGWWSSARVMSMVLQSYLLEAAALRLFLEARFAGLLLFPVAEATQCSSSRREVSSVGP